MASEGLVKLVHANHIDKIISVLQQSPMQNKVYFIKLLEAIGENESLTSNTLFRSLKSRRLSLSTPAHTDLFTLVFLPVWAYRQYEEYDEYDEYEAPNNLALPKCNKAGSCGFLVKRECCSSRELILEEESVYRQSRVHYHNYFSAEDMRFYREVRIEMQDGDDLLLPISIKSLEYVQRVWKKWLPGSSFIYGEEDLMYFCIQKFLVFRHR